MKFDLGETQYEKEERLRKWHRFFAWYPVRLGTHDFRWLEMVERQIIMIPGYGGSEATVFYRAVKDN